MLLGDINGKFDFIAEHMSGHATRLESVEKLLGGVANNVEIIKLDIEFIKKELKSKVSYDEFAALEKRVSFLESRRL